MNILDDFVIENGVLEKYTGSNTEVTIPEEVKGIGTRAFLGSKVKRFEVPETSKKFKSVNGIILSKDGKKLILYPPYGECEIPESVEQISGGAFRGMDCIKTDSGYENLWIIIPPTVKKLAKNAFTFKPEFGSGAFTFVSDPDFVKLIPSPVYLGDISVLPPKEKREVTRGFLKAVECKRSEIHPYMSSYIEYIRDNVKNYIRWTYIHDFGKEFEEIFHLFVREKLIPKNRIQEVMNEFEKMGRTDLIAELLDYQNTYFGKKGTGQIKL